MADQDAGDDIGQGHGALAGGGLRWRVEFDLVLDLTELDADGDRRPVGADVAAPETGHLAPAESGVGGGQDECLPTVVDDLDEGLDLIGCGDTHPVGVLGAGAA